jgi:hypothetical protein
MRKRTIIASILLTLVICGTKAVLRIMEWGENIGEYQSAYAATATADHMKRFGVYSGWEDPAELVKLSLEQWYGYDYTDGYFNWAQEMCKYMTTGTCMQEVFTRNNRIYWTDNVIPQKIQSVAEVTPVKAVWEKSVYDENVGYYIKSQIWEYKIVGNLQPDKEFIQYVMIGDYGIGWLMIHNLLDNEAAQLLQAIATEEATEVPVK